MPWKDPNRPKLVRDLEGRKAKTRREMQTSQMVIPEGAAVTVSYANQWSKITVKAEPCTCCGVSIVVCCDVSALAFEPKE